MGEKELEIGECARKEALFLLVNSWPGGKNALENFQKIFLRDQTIINLILKKNKKRKQKTPGSLDCIHLPPPFKVHPLHVR